MALEGRLTGNDVCVVVELAGEALQAVARMLGESDILQQSRAGS